MTEIQSQSLVQENNINVWGYLWSSDINNCERCDACPTVPVCDTVEPEIKTEAYERCDIITAKTFLPAVEE